MGIKDYGEDKKEERFASVYRKYQYRECQGCHLLTLKYLQDKNGYCTKCAKVESKKSWEKFDKL